MKQFSIVNVPLMAHVLFLLCTPLLFAAEYYVSNSGNDEGSGTIPAQAWKTLSKVNEFKFSPGDVIHFEKGGTWREPLIPHSGSKDGHVTYTSYGEGSKPLLLGSVEKNNPDDWKKERANIWSTGPFGVDVGNIIFNNGQVCGIKVWEESDLDKQDEFCFDRKTNVVKMYSIHNPAQMYDDIECALKRHIINEGGRRYVIYDGLHLAYGAAHGIGGGGTHHIIVRNCDLCFIGGGHQHTKKTKRGPRHVRYGNGIEFWDSAHDNLVENCRIWDIYDAGLTNQGGGKNSQYNITYRNNTIWNCEYSFEYWNRPETSATHDIYFENNVCFNAGSGWSHGQPYRRGSHLQFFNNTAKTYNFYVRNNVFHRAESAPIVIAADNWNGLDKLVLDNNVYIQPPDKPLAWWRGAGDANPFFPRDFEAYKRSTGKDAHSKLITLPPLVVEPAAIELHVNDTQKLKVSGQYSDDVTMDVTHFASFRSSDRAVASVEWSGQDKCFHVKGLHPGKAVITITFRGSTATASVTVVP